MFTSRIRFIGNEPFHQTVFFVLLCALAVAIPTSRTGMSTVQILLGVNWLFEGRFHEKLKRFFQNKPALIFTAIYMVHILGLIWTENLVYGITSDLKTKLPIFVLAFIIGSSKPLRVKQLYVILILFIATVFVISVIGTSIYLSGNYLDFRQVSPFISHVYVSLMALISAIILPWLIKRLIVEKKWHFAAYLFSAWLVAFLFVLKSFTGMFALTGVLLFFIIRWIYLGRNVVLNLTVASLLILLTFAFGYTTLKMYKRVSMEIDAGKPDKYESTALGNLYFHDLQNDQRENGHLIYYYISEHELRKAWNERSSLDYDGNDLRGNKLRFTLFRYMASKGLKKDQEGLNELNDKDIKAIEKGIPNYLYTQWPGLLVRIHQSTWEIYWYKQNQSPTGHTVAQRLELWRASWVAFKEKPVFGWGTGDLFAAMEFGLKSLDSKLGNYRMKPHNQYLLFLITLGIAGSLAIYICIFVYVWFTKAYRYFPFNAFLVILLVSMLGNHIIDSQEGVTLFAFFSLLFGILFPRSQTGTELKA